MYTIINTLINSQLLLEAITRTFSGWWIYIILFGVIFSETGLLVGFFLPGDSLLFTIGVIAGAGDLNIYLITGILTLAAIIGDSVGYFLGRKFGVVMSAHGETWYYKREYIERTRAFFEKHGSKTIMYARFVPIVRTFAPFVAGMASMPYKTFVIFNVLGGIVWVSLVVTIGHFLGGFVIVQQNFEKVILLIILLSFLPVIIEMLRSKRGVR